MATTLTDAGTVNAAEALLESATAMLAGGGFRKGDCAGGARVRGQAGGGTLKTGERNGGDQ